MRILVTGVAKAGKSTVLRVLSEMNYITVNASDLLINSGCVKWNNEVPVIRYYRRRLCS